MKENCKTSRYMCESRVCPTGEIGGVLSLAENLLTSPLPPIWKNFPSKFLFPHHFLIAPN